MRMAASLGRSLKSHRLIAKKSVSVGATSASARNERIKVATSDGKPWASVGAGSVMSTSWRR